MPCDNMSGFDPQLTSMENSSAGQAVVNRRSVASVRKSYLMALPCATGAAMMASHYAEQGIDDGRSNIRDTGLRACRYARRGADLSWEDRPPRRAVRGGRHRRHRGAGGFGEAVHRARAISRGREPAGRER